MTIAPSCLDVQTLTVQFLVTPPPFELGDPGRKGGRHRWWIARGGYGSRGWTRRTGYVELDPAGGATSAVERALFRASLVAGVPYCLGVGDARYPIVIPDGARAALIEPVDLTTAIVTFADADGAPLQALPTGVDPEPVPF